MILIRTFQFLNKFTVISNNTSYYKLVFFSDTLNEWFWDTFEKTPPMATYSIAIVISEFSYLSYNISGKSDKLVNNC